MGLSLGAVDYYTKPYDRQELLNTLKKHERVLKVPKKPTSVLIIDDDPKFLELMEAILAAEGISLTKAQSGEEGVDLALAMHPDIIFLDLLMPEVNGFEVIDRLKSHPVARNIPIIVCTGKDVSAEEKGILAGKIRKIIQKGKSLREGILDEIRKFEQHYPGKAGMVDGLTGLLNERYFQKRLVDELNRLRRFSRPFSVLMANVDHFDLYNERNGAEAGNLVLTVVGAILRKGLRTSDLICRHEGSTFSAILPATLSEHAHMVGDRLRYIVENNSFPHEGSLPGGQVTVSLGIATCTEGIQSGKEVITRLSRALQTAKKDGGNRVIMAGGDRS